MTKGRRYRQKSPYLKLVEAPGRSSAPRQQQEARSTTRAGLFLLNQAAYQSIASLLNRRLTLFRCLQPAAAGAAAARTGVGAVARLVADDVHLGTAHGAGGRDPVQGLGRGGLHAVSRQAGEQLTVGFGHALERV